MPRVHAPELNDERWLPHDVRDGLTAFLQVSTETMRLFDDARPVLRDVFARHRARGGAARIVDLCSGGGGPLLSILERLDDAAGPGFEAVLTDLFPNHPAFDAAEARRSLRARGVLVRAHRAPVDATRVPPELEGVRTLFNALHHFRPDDARRILDDAARKRQPLCAFEVVERHPASLAVIATVPLAVLALTPLTRPDRRRLALTYAVPVIPLASGWDGVASCLRSYSLEELRALAASVQVDGYRFTVGRQKRGAIPLRVTWLVGEPT